MKQVLAFFFALIFFSLIINLIIGLKKSDSIILNNFFKQKSSNYLLQFWHFTSCSIYFALNILHYWHRRLATRLTDYKKHKNINNLKIIWHININKVLLHSSSLSIWFWFALELNIVLNIFIFGFSGVIFFGLNSSDSISERFRLDEFDDK